jgi:gamma-glutamyltranspeptidase
MLEAGGNAADAGAATLLALSVLTVGAFCIGCEVPILYYSGDTKTVKVLSGQGGAPYPKRRIVYAESHSRRAAMRGTVPAAHATVTPPRCMARSRLPRACSDPQILMFYVRGTSIQAATVNRNGELARLISP